MEVDSLQRFKVIDKPNKHCDALEIHTSTRRQIHHTVRLHSDIYLVLLLIYLVLLAGSPRLC